jgi:hypothetical protein
LHDYLGPAIGESREPRPATDNQRDYAEFLGLDISRDTVSVASAKIAQHLFALNQQALRKLQLKPGDRVRRISSIEIDGQPRTYSQEFIVSSIQPNARVYFKGIGCQAAWPVHLEKVA